MVIDRIDLQFGANECCRSVSRPPVRDWSKLEQMTRFLAGYPRLVYEYKFQGEQQMPTAYSDASWAGNASDRRSTSGGVFMHGSHCVKSWSKTPSLVALSSAESELYAMVKASAEAMGFQSVIRDLGTTVVYSVASAALGCHTTPRSGKTQTRGWQFLTRAEPGRAEGCAIYESAGERQSCGHVLQGPQC